MKKILIADDEALIRRLVCDFLHKNGYETVEAENGAQALKLFSSERGEIDLAVLDIMMPEMDGWEVCRRIRETSNVPIIFLTARSQEFDELSGFEAGCDDFVTKPFSPTVLVKRIEALLKRAGRSSEGSSDKLTIDGLVIDVAAHEVTLSGANVELTIKEFNILQKLASSPGRTYSRDQLLDDVWGFDFSGDPRTVDSHVARLRTKLGKWGEEYLKTIYGVGYKIEVHKN